MNMNQTSAVTTGGIAISSATLMPAVEWILGLMFHVPVPPSVSSLVAGVVVAGVHAGINAVKARTEAKSAAPSA
jgi:small basic protein